MAEKKEGNKIAEILFGKNPSVAKFILGANLDTEKKLIRESLVVRAGREGTTAEEVVAFGEEDIQELKGASVKVSLNPVDWVKDPAGTFGKTFFGGPIGSITDWDEYRAVAKESLWKDLTEGRLNLNPEGPSDYELYDKNDYRVRHAAPFEEVYLKGSAADVIEKFPDATYDTDKDAYFVVKSPALPDTSREDHYVGVSNALTKYLVNSVASGVRNENFHKFNVEAMGACQKEIKELQPESNADFGRFSAVAREKIKSLEKNIGTRQTVIDSATELSGVVKSLVEENNKTLLTGNLSSSKTRIARDADGRVVTDAAGRAVKETVVTDHKAEFHASYTKLKQKLKTLDEDGKKDAAALIKLVEDIDNKLYVQSGRNREITDNNGKILNVLQLKEGEFFKDTIDGGVVDKLSRSSLSRLLNDADFKSILDEEYYNDDGRQRVFSRSARNLLNVVNTAHKDWSWEAINDTISDVFDGKIWQQLAITGSIIPGLNLLRRVERITPHYWIGKMTASFSEKVGLTRAIARYEDFWTGIQNKTIGKVMVPLQYRLQLLRKKIGDLIEKAISKYLGGGLAGATGGLSLVIGKVVGRIARIGVQVIVNRTSKFISDVWKTVRKLDFSGLDDIVQNATKAMFVFIASCAAVFAGIAFLIFTIITVILSAFGSSDTTRVSTDISGRIVYDSGLYAFGSYDAENCPVGDVLDLTFDNDSSNGPARRAHDLVTELMRGFWCYWNRSPEYDSSTDVADLFDEIEFSINSFPGSGIRNCADCLFWCTWLPYIAYDYSFDTSVSYLGAQKMFEYFRSEQVFVDPSSPGASGLIQSGDIAFFQTGTGSGWHTGMVYYTNSDVVMTIHSNAPFKELPLTVRPNNSVQSPDSSLIQIVGFGRPR